MKNLWIVAGLLWIVVVAAEAAQVKESVTLSKSFPELSGGTGCKPPPKPPGE
jgi:hypothetical protein